MNFNCIAFIDTVCIMYNSGFAWRLMYKNSMIFRALRGCTPPLQLLSRLHVKWGLQKPHLFAYNALVDNANFLKFRICLIILVKHIYIVTLKVPRKWLLLDNNCNAYARDTIQWKDNTNNIHKIIYNFFLHWGILWTLWRRFHLNINTITCHFWVLNVLVVWYPDRLDNNGNRSQLGLNRSPV